MILRISDCSKDLRNPFAETTKRFTDSEEVPIRLDNCVNMAKIVIAGMIFFKTIVLKITSIQKEYRK